MSDDTSDKEDKKSNIISFPGGKSTPKDLGADYVISQSNVVSTNDIPDTATINREISERKSYVKNQELVKSIESGSPTGSIIDQVLLEIAEELSHLKYERRKAVKEGKSTIQHTVFRVSSLKSLTELLIKRKEASLSERLDLKSPRFQAVFKVWMNFFHESMDKVGIPQEQIDLVFQQMRTDMLDWEKKMDMSGIGE